MARLATMIATALFVAAGLNAGAMAADRVGSDGFSTSAIFPMKLPRSL
ncbi:hypothetical protein [Hankyongella ginsenosidimutans]|nr:hypothetical protein [Hankyongella ginsenosidimutans]